MSNIEALQETYGLLEHLVCELMVIFSGILCIVGIRHMNFKLICLRNSFWCSISMHWNSIHLSVTIIVFFTGVDLKSKNISRVIQACVDVTVYCNWWMFSTQTLKMRINENVKVDYFRFWVMIISFVYY